MSHVQDHKATVDRIEDQNDSASFANPAPSSLFPAYAAASGQQATGWLQNASFRAMSAPKQPEIGTADQDARSKHNMPRISAPTSIVLQPQNEPTTKQLAACIRAEAPASC